MTNEELKNMLFIIDTLLDDAITDSTRQKVKDKLTEVCQLAMKALEQTDVLDKIRAEILDEAEYAYADFDRYKEAILYAEPDELPDDDFRYGLERAVEIIDKHRK